MLKITTVGFFLRSRPSSVHLWTAVLPCKLFPSKILQSITFGQAKRRRQPKISSPRAGGPFVRLACSSYPPTVCACATNPLCYSIACLKRRPSRPEFTPQDTAEEPTGLCECRPHSRKPGRRSARQCLPET